MWTKQEDDLLLKVATWAHPTQWETAILLFKGKFERSQLVERLNHLRGKGREEEAEDRRSLLFNNRLARINNDPKTQEAKWRSRLRLPPLPPPTSSFQKKPQERRNWFQDEKNSVFNTEEKKLERKLGPPGEEDADDGSSITRHIKKEPKDKSILSLAGKHFSPSSTKTTSHQRTAPGPVLSFRKNLASGGSSSNGVENDSTTSNGVVLKNQQCDDDVKTMEPKRQGGMFVNINMCGVPIGRKVDLNAHNSYEQLSFTVDKLFRGLLAAQRDLSSSSIEDEKPITGLLGGNGEYTLTYEDNEGDKMLVGDVPWQMFVSSVKRLRVIKSSEISSALTYGNGKQEKMKKRSFTALKK